MYQMKSTTKKKINEAKFRIAGELDIGSPSVHFLHGKSQGHWEVPRFYAIEIPYGHDAQELLVRTQELDAGATYSKKHNEIWGLLDALAPELIPAMNEDFEAR